LGYSFYFTQVIDAGNAAAENPVPIEAAVGCAPETLFQVTAVKGQDESGRLQRCRNIGNVVDFSVNQADLIPGQAAVAGIREGAFDPACGGVKFMLIGKNQARLTNRYRFGR